MNQLGLARRKIYILLCAFVLTMGVAALVLLLPEPAEAAPRRKTDELIQAFQGRDMAGFLSLLEFPLDLTLNDDARVYTEQDIRAQLGLVYQNYTSIGIDPENFHIDVDERGRNAAVRFDFHWRLRDRVFAGPPDSSRRTNPGGAPESAFLTLTKSGNDWRVTAVQLRIHAL